MDPFPKVTPSLKAVGASGGM
eukprot:COSAG02_NODE_57006_length_282_cov_1.136612_1_plen_20_part_10